MTKVFNQINLKSRRRLLRRNTTFAERLLWNGLRQRQLTGYKFRRQYSVGGFILDFYCVERKLAVEVDGDTHFSEEAKAKDLIRENIIKKYGIEILRFTNIDVYKNTGTVLEKIKELLTTKTSP